MCVLLYADSETGGLSACPRKGRHRLCQEKAKAMSWGPSLRQPGFPVAFQCFEGVEGLH